MTTYSAYVPCFNQARTVRAAVESLLAQRPAPAEVLVIDDGSSDDPVAALAGLPVAVLRQEKNFGRGAARSRAMAAARHEWVLCCDATNRLPEGFVSRAQSWGAEPKVAAVCGRIRDPNPRDVAARWRARHLFKQAGGAGVNRRAALATYGAWVRRSALVAVGGYDPSLRHSEDVELGSRLLAAGYEVVFDPELVTESNVINTPTEVLERYWRWHANHDEAFSVAGFFRHSWYALRTLAARDLASGDLAAAALSLWLPFFLLGKTGQRRLTGARQKPPVKVS